MSIAAGARPDRRFGAKAATTLQDFPKFSKMSGAAPSGSNVAGWVWGCGYGWVVIDSMSISIEKK